MEYLGTDFIYNIASNKILKEFANGEYICYIIISPTENHAVLAIPRNYIYHYINCTDSAFLCDMFKVDTTLTYDTNNGQIYFHNEEEIKDWAMSFTKGICTIQRNIADISTLTCLNDLERIRYGETQEINDEYCDFSFNEIRLSSEYDIASREYIIKDAKGGILISLKQLSSQKNFFKLVLKSINGLIQLFKE